jgi:hypothetical protein
MRCVRPPNDSPICCSARPLQSTPPGRHDKGSEPSGGRGKYSGVKRKPQPSLPAALACWAAIYDANFISRKGRDSDRAQPVEVTTMHWRIVLF